MSRLIRLVVGVAIVALCWANLMLASRSMGENKSLVETEWKPPSSLGSKNKLLATAPRFYSKSTETIDQNATASSSPTNRRIVLVHVGKTGGESVRHTLRITCSLRQNPNQRKLCLRAFSSTQVESALSKHTTGTLHCNLLAPSQSLKTATTLLFTLRNPMTRIVSWFRYMHPANCRPHEDFLSTACNTNRSIYNYARNPKGSQWTSRFFGCFTTVNQFSQALEGKNSTNDACSNIAWRTIRGAASPSSGHAYYNHQFYWNETIAKRKDLDVWVVRTESLWQDLDKIEKLLLPIPSRITQSSHPKRNVTHGSEGHSEKEELTPSSRLLLCCALRAEIATYARILERASNLDALEKSSSLENVAAYCGAESWDKLSYSVCTG